MELGSAAGSLEASIAACSIAAEALCFDLKVNETDKDLTKHINKPKQCFHRSMMFKVKFVKLNKEHFVLF